MIKSKIWSTNSRDLVFYLFLLDLGKLKIIMKYWNDLNTGVKRLYYVFSVILLPTLYSSEMFNVDFDEIFFIFNYDDRFIVLILFWFFLVGVVFPGIIMTIMWIIEGLKKWRKVYLWSFYFRSTICLVRIICL